MKRASTNRSFSPGIPWIAAVALLAISPTVQAAEGPPATHVQQINPTSVEVLLPENHRVTLDFYGQNIFRIFRDDTGGIIRDPQSEPPAQILVDTPRRNTGDIRTSEEGDKVTISTKSIAVEVDRKTTRMKVTDLHRGKVVLEEAAPAALEKERVTLTFTQQPDEHFYGGGVQNGRFSHKGKSIAIENQNSWTDGGVASPNPYYWSTRGYGIISFNSPATQ